MCARVCVCVCVCVCFLGVYLYVCVKRLWAPCAMVGVCVCVDVSVRVRIYVCVCVFVCVLPVCCLRVIGVFSLRLVFGSEKQNLCSICYERYKIRKCACISKRILNPIFIWRADV